MKLLTVFTPTYNRAYCLNKCYESLLAQTNPNFVWLIVDDGSSDGTAALVQSWIQEGKIEIQYHYQENQGMHGGHNTAYSLIKTPLNVCIDSDDYMPHDAVEIILDNWDSIKEDESCAGLVGLDMDESGNIIGCKIPEKVTTSSLYDLYKTHRVHGDKKLVYKTEVIKKYPSYPIFKGEKLVPLGTLYLMIDQDYKLKTINEVLCIVEYLDDGSSKNILKQYKRSPRGFLHSRVLEMKYSKSFTYTFTRAVHYVSSCLFINRFNFFRGNPKKIITLAAIPFGLLWHLYIISKIRNENSSTHK